MSYFMINMNHLSKKNLKNICPTDSRLRPDLRAYEHNDLDLADEEKLRMEENQRKRRKERKKNKVEH